MQFASGNQGGQFSFTRTFTNSWQVRTGISNESLSYMPIINNSYYSGQLTDLPANSFVIFEVIHNDNIFNEESARLVIDGDFVVNPIEKLIIQ